MDVSREKLAEYRAGLAELEAQRLEARRARNERAWRVARAAAGLLKERFGAQRVVAFGSILWPRFFFERVVRNVYTFNIRPQRVRELVEQLPECMERISADVLSFCAFLEAADA